jgi:hypothetical protein
LKNNKQVVYYIDSNRDPPSYGEIDPILTDEEKKERLEELEEEDRKFSEQNIRVRLKRNTIERELKE